MLRFVVMLVIASALATTIPAYLISHRSHFAPPAGRAATVPAHERTAEVASVKPPVHSGRSVELGMDGRGNFVSDFRLNGHRVTGVVDTGASAVAINATTARQIGISLAPSDFRYDVQTANGQTKAASAVIDEIAIGRIRVENVQAMVLDDDALSTTLVGMSFLNQLSHFQVEGDRLVLVQ